jgi:hypothetical protein
MEEFNSALYGFFTGNAQPGSIGLVGTKDAIGLAIREAQSAVTVSGNASLWSHCFLFGEPRLDRRGPGRTRSSSTYIFESDLKVNLFKPQIRNGAQENWIGKWCREDVENAAVIDFGLSAEQRSDVLSTALQLVDEQVLYPIQELLGTWWHIIVKKQWKQNPLDAPHAIYCSSFVRYCFRESGRDFLDNTISVSNTTPEDIAQAAIRAEQ